MMYWASTTTGRINVDDDDYYYDEIKSNWKWANSFWLMSGQYRHTHEHITPV